MCGLFGWAAASPNSCLDIHLLEEIAVDTESRGRHSFGLAWLDSRNRLRMFKHTGAISRHLDVLQMVMDARLLIGHCRYATHGAINTLNAHPHASDGGWVVHNGQIWNYEAINDQFDLSPVTECDSETLALLIENADGSLTARVKSAMQVVCETNRPFAMMGLWKSPNRMIIGRHGNPLHLSRDSEGIYFASLDNALRNPSPVADRSIISLGLKNDGLEMGTTRLSRQTRFSLG